MASEKGTKEYVTISKEAFELMQAQIAALMARVDKLEAENAELKEQVGKDSHNSSKPPSSDSPYKPSPHSLREKSGKKPGGQVGHKGAGMKLPHDPNIFKELLPERCTTCTEASTCKALEKSRCKSKEKRHVVDIKVTTDVTEYDRVTVKCPAAAGEIIRGEFPEGVAGTIQYGAGIRSLVVANCFVGIMSVSRNSEMIEAISGVELSDGTIENMISEFARKAAPTVESIKERLVDCNVVNFDETGITIDKILEWLQNASNEYYTYQIVHEKRGREGHDAAGILPGFRHTAVHDFWAPYFSYTLATHAMCCAHLLRELVGVYENTGQAWCAKMKKLLMDIKEAKELLIEKGVFEFLASDWLRYSKRYDKIIKAALAANPAPRQEQVQIGRPKKGKVLSLIERFQNHKEKICRFATDFNVPFTNNQAERDQRMLKVRMKVSGCFRSKKGADDYATIYSYISTARKQGWKLIDAIRTAIEGKGDSILPKIVNVASCCI
jgi:transposase